MSVERRRLGGRLLLLAALLLAAPTPAALAQNVVEGDNEADDEQDGESMSGDAIAGQVVGANSDGQTSIDATNRSEDVSIETGDAEAFNGGFEVPQRFDVGGGSITAAQVDESELDVFDDASDPDDEFDFAESSTGDGIGGQVIGVTTAATGVVDAVAANTSEDVRIETGDAEAWNDAIAQTGTGIGGQVLGIVAAGLTSVDSTNLTREADIETGDAFANDDAIALTGDGVGGQVSGVVTAEGASADVVQSNISEMIDLLTGDATVLNVDLTEVGFIGDTIQDGDNES